jgi:hypothetical protein
MEEELFLFRAWFLDRRERRAKTGTDFCTLERGPAAAKTV